MKVNTTALIRAAMVSVWYLTAVTILSEIYKPLKDFFVKVGNHHWTGKSLIMVGLFFVAYLVFLKTKESENPDKAIKSLIIQTVIGGAAILGFFVWHYFA